MPHFTTTDSLKFRSYLIAHGVDASAAQKVASKIHQKSKRNTPLTDEETALVEGYKAKEASSPSGAKSLKSSGADVSHKVNPGRVKFNDITLKRGYTATSHKVSEVGFKFFSPNSSDKSHTRHWGDPHLSNKVQMASGKIQKISSYSPGTVRQLAYKVASS